MRRRLAGVLALIVALLAGTQQLAVGATRPIDGPSAYQTLGVTTSRLEAQVAVSPSQQGGFTAPGAAASFDITITNDSGTSESYDLTGSSSWSVAFFEEDGVTPLTTTGSVANGDTVTVVAAVTAPVDAVVGDAATAEVTVTPVGDSAASETVSLRVAIPASFAQVFRDRADNDMSLYLADAGRQTRARAATDVAGEEMAVAATRSGFVYAWTEVRGTDDGDVREIQYALLDGAGEMDFGPATLVDHPDTSPLVRDHLPAVAVTPNGRIGMLWYRELFYGSDDYNYNVFFAMVGPSGVFGPVNLTSNAARGPRSEVVRYRAPSIAATGDNRFVLAWERAEDSGAEQVVDAFYAVRDDDGGQVKGITRYLSSVPGTYYYSPTPTAVGYDRWLMAYSGPNGISFAVLDSEGNVVLEEQVVAQFDFGDDPDAVELSDGSVLLAWTTRESTPRTIAYAILDGQDFEVTTGPVVRDDSIGPGAEATVSVAAGRDARGILAWTDADAASRRNLYYALVNSGGDVLTPPMMFYSSDGGGLSTAYPGYGIVSYEVAAEGRVTNIRHEPVFNADVASPEAIVPTVTTDGRGAYGLDFQGSGTYTVTASADGFGTLPPRYGLDVAGTVTGVDFVLPPEGDVVLNGGWESGGLDDWHTGPGVAPTVEMEARHTGRYGLDLASADSGTLYFWPYVTQTVSIPSTWTRPTLSFMYRVMEGDPLDDELAALVSSGSSVITHSVPLTPGGWMHAWHDLSGFSGESVTVRFGFADQEAGQRVYLDEVSVGDARVGAYSIYMPVIARNS